MGKRKAIVVGAGIGGLTTALALAQRGWQVQIFEQAAQLSALGAGIQLGPNATRLLQALGLGASLASRGFCPQAIEARDWSSGRCLSRQALGETALRRWGAPYLQLHRADLQQLLRQAVREQAQISLTLDTPVEALDAQGARVRTPHGWQSADLVIGADGIHSRIRECLFGAQPARFTGQTAWRLLIPTRQLAAPQPPPNASIWMGPGRHLVHYYLREARLLNVVLVAERATWPHESWSQPGDFDALVAECASAHPTLRSLIDAARTEPRCFHWGLFDRAPLAQWHRDRGVLLGDACHPSLPFLAQGAAMAIEDAAVLAACLDTTADISQALQRYSARRKPRCDAIQAASRRNARIFHLRGGLATLRNLALRSGLASPRRTTRWLYNYKALDAEPLS